MAEEYFNQFRKNAREKGIPIGGKFELTPRCTLDCKMCYVHLTEKQMCGRSELPTSKWIEIIDQAYKAGLTFALLTGGECMLHPGFAKIYEHLQKLGVITTVNTNGLYLSEENIELFRRIPPRGFNVSLYGTSDAVYKEVAGVDGAYQKVVHNILRLKELGFFVSVSITVSKYLLSDVSNVVDFCRKNGLKKNINVSLFDAREDTCRSIDDFGLTVDEQIDVLRKVRLCDNRTLFDNPSPVSPPERCPDNVILRCADCGAGRESYLITWNGELRPCFLISDISENLLEKSFEDAWNSLHAVSIQMVIPSECEICALKKYCHACFLRRADPKHPSHCNPEMCSLTKKKITAGIVKYNP